MSTVEQEPLLTVGEVARWLRLSTRTVHRLTERGDLACVRLGHSVRFRPADVRAVVGETAITAGRTS